MLPQLGHVVGVFRGHPKGVGEPYEIALRVGARRVEVGVRLFGPPAEGRFDIPDGGRGEQNMLIVECVCLCAWVCCVLCGKMRE